MNKLIRAIKEYLNPGLKCKRIGHNHIERKAIIRRRSKEYGVTCNDFKVKFFICTRCGDSQGPVDEEYLNYWTNVTMPDFMWQDIDKQGYVKIRSD